MTNEGTSVSGPAEPADSGGAELAQPALIAVTGRRTFTAERKQALLGAYGAADAAGRRALLERENISASTLRRWRKALETPSQEDDQSDDGRLRQDDTVAEAEESDPAGGLDRWSQVIQRQRALAARQEAVSATRPALSEGEPEDVAADDGPTVGAA
jgi:transposase-like protein